MLAAVLWGVVASSSFVVGGAIALVQPPRRSWVALGAGFGAGALLGAVAYELIDEAGLKAGRPLVVTAGLLGGTAVAGSVMAGVGGLRRALAEATTGPPAVVHRFGTLLLSVASEVVIIVGALHGHGLSVAVILAVFLCGVPEAVVGTAILRGDGVPRRRVMEMWLALTAYGGVIAVPAWLVVTNGSGNLVAVLLALAGGVVLAGIVAHLVPTSFARLGVLCAFPVVAGFSMSVGLIGIG